MSEYCHYCSGKGLVNPYDDHWIYCPECDGDTFVWTYDEEDEK